MKSFSYVEYQQLLKLPLADKIMRAKILILHELKEHKRPCVACSWGKDSIVMLHLIRSVCKNVLIRFNNTGVEYPQTYAYRDVILKEWQVDIDKYFETVPIMTFFQCVKKYGYPKIRQMANRPGSNKPNRKYATPRCCYYLKEKPAKDWLKKFQIDLEFVGLQASESNVRRMSFLREGEAFDSKTYGCRIVRPLMIWTDKDIWDYHKQENIPHNPLYDIMKRNGCMPCTGFIGWKKIMAKANPKLYKVVSRQIGEPTLADWCDKGVEDGI